MLRYYIMFARICKGGKWMFSKSLQLTEILPLIFLKVIDFVPKR